MTPGAYDLAGSFMFVDQGVNGAGFQLWDKCGVEAIGIDHNEAIGEFLFQFRGREQQVGGWGIFTGAQDDEVPVHSFVWFCRKGVEDIAGIFHPDVRMNGPENFLESYGDQGDLVDDENVGRSWDGHAQISEILPEALVCVYLYICCVSGLTAGRKKYEHACCHQWNG